MKQLLTSYTRYEKWANQQLLDVVLTLSAEQQEQEIASSFSSIRKTCLHVWDASAIWWQRLQQTDAIHIPSKQAYTSMKEITEGLLRQNDQWIQWIEHSTDAALEHNLAFKTMKGDPFVQPVKDIVLHLNNHGTYHRGQLVTLLRQAGVEQLPQTDFILYARLVKTT
jgi:uncharacterized damage-inducible protein DinB